MQYPLGEHERDRITSRTGKKLDQLTLDEVMKIQDEGRVKRREAEAKLTEMEEELKQKLLSMRK